ncbi:HAD family phosphatase [Actinomadura sp. NEAU-AAG7]|uniref:HAD family hydrolase n=1 Tax=Actinomadura sp. NEAU-AAG7 TaxID=2839640 RepID=UPI001BE3E38F|nr:HAD family phosphatase [Actinomadura sp. NEAU-AAG7]MBT2210106.1 HAD family phosphatase [Actinomadura sp. NEAU-AAG7]
MPSPSSPTTVVFDIGGVIIDWDPRYLYRRLIPDEAEMERFLTEVCSGAWNAQQDRGRSFIEAIEELAARHPGQRELIMAYWERWDEMLGDPIPGVADIMTELHQAGVPMVAITNWSAETYPIAVREHPELKLFRDAVVSGEVRLSKPDPEIFRYALDRFGLAPHEALFIDDNRANTAAADALGIGTHLFTGAPALRATLETAGLL